jgi:hypothetical protein
MPSAAKPGEVVGRSGAMCNLNMQVSSSPKGGPSMSQSSKSAQILTYLDQLRELGLDALATEGNAEDLYIADHEIKGLIQERLGYSHDPEKITRVSALQHDLQVSRLVWGDALEHQKVKPREFFDRFNAQMLKTFQMCDEVLGKRDFERLFNAAPADAAHLIDPTTFFGLSK